MHPSDPPVAGAASQVRAEIRWDTGGEPASSERLAVRVVVFTTAVSTAVWLAVIDKAVAVNESWDWPAGIVNKRGTIKVRWLLEIETDALCESAVINVKVQVAASFE